MLTWHYITRAAYDALSTSQKTTDKLFFIKYGDKFYNGTNTFNEYIIVYNTQPGTSVVDRVYINKNDLKGMIWDGDSWNDLIYPVIRTGDEVLASADIASVRYNSTYGNLILVTMDDTEETIEMTDIALDIVFSSTGMDVRHCWAYTDSGKKTDIAPIVNKITYNNNTAKITIYFDAIGTYRWELPFNNTTYSNTGANVVTITGNHFIAECVAYYNEANTYEVTNGIYTVYRVDNGDTVINSIDMVNTTISNIISTAFQLTDTMYTVGFGHTNEILVADDVGNAKASGIELSTEVSRSPDNYHVPTEKAIHEYLDENIIEAGDVTSANEFAMLNKNTASETKVPSEKAIVTQMSWIVI